MKYRVFKNAVPHTNKRNLQHDLTVYENTMQALHFALEGVSLDDACGTFGEGLQQLLRSGHFGSVSLWERNQQCQLWEEGIQGHDVQHQRQRLKCSELAIDIQLRGRPFSVTQVTDAGLPSSPLTAEQMTELGSAYHEQNDINLKICRKIAYYKSVTYRTHSSRVGDYLTGEGLDWISITVNTGSICEVLEENGEIAHVLIIGIMRHEKSVFFVVRWFAHTGRVHPQYHLKEYRLCNLFDYAAFLSLKTIDDRCDGITVERMSRDLVR